MRRLGSEFELKDERDKEMYSVFKYYISLPGQQSMTELAEMIINTPTSRFWVTPERVSIVIHALNRGESLDDMSPSKREMFSEIYSRYKVLRESHPDATVYDLSRLVVTQPAPKLYMTKASVIVTLHHIRNTWKKAGKRK